MRGSLVLAVVLTIIVIESAVPFVLFVPVVPETAKQPCLSPNCAQPVFVFNYSGSISFHYLGVGMVFGACNGFEMVTSSRNSPTFCVQSYLRLYATASSFGSSTQNINATIWEVNTLHSTNEVDVAPNWSGVLGISAQGCFQGWPMGQGLLKGHYVASNASQGQLVPYPFTFSCPAEPIILRSLTFQPNSTTAIATTNFGTPTWDINQSFIYQNLSPGEYTIIACDEWGHTVFAYFSVRS